MAQGLPLILLKQVLGFAPDYLFIWPPFLASQSLNCLISFVCAAILTDVEGALVAPYVATSGYGRPPLHTKRELFNAIFYLARAGCAWQLLPHDLPPWRTVHNQFKAWREDGTQDRLTDGLRRVVRQPKRPAEPTAGAIDTQSMRTGAKRELSRL